MPGSIPGYAYRPRRSEFSVDFSETRVNTGQDPLERPTRRARPGPRSGKLALKPTTQLIQEAQNQVETMRKKYLWIMHHYQKILQSLCLTISGVVLCSKLVDGRCRVQSPVALFDIAQAGTAVEPDTSRLPVLSAEPIRHW